MEILDVATCHCLLHELRGRGAIFRISLYADEAANFIAPKREDIINLSNILDEFGEITGLCIKF
jgi:hypothetical protein